jgi:4'-phosphopantetheinyl transferase
MIEVNYCDTRGTNGSTDVLSREERERCARFAFEEDRRDYAAAHTLLRIRLAELLNISPASLRFGATQRGKPFLLPPYERIRFSLAHARGVVACAISDEACIGVDVERVDTSVRVQDLAQRFFPPEERDPGRFLELWTMKEALAKALGVSIAEVLALNVAALEEWSCVVFDLEDAYKLALATPRQFLKPSAPLLHPTA